MAKYSYLKRFGLIGVFIGSQIAAQFSYAQQTNLEEIVRQLQRRIDELEQKVKTLESGKASGQLPAGEPAKSRLDELDQQVKTLEQNQKADQVTIEARAKAMPKLHQINPTESECWPLAALNTVMFRAGSVVEVSRLG